MKKFDQVLIDDVVLKTSVPDFVTSVAQSRVAFQRIDKFLNNENINENLIEKIPEKDENAIEIEDATFKWDPQQMEPTLQNINLNIKEGITINIF